MTEPAFARGSDKAPDAYRTISEVANELGLPQHVLRFWESRFVQIRPLKRAGGRRYYRPDEISLLKGIQHLLYNEGYTIKGVQKVLKTQGVRTVQGLGTGRPMSDLKKSIQEEPEDIIEDDIRDNISPLTFEAEQPEQDIDEQLAEAYGEPEDIAAPQPLQVSPASVNAPSLFDMPLNPPFVSPAPVAPQTYAPVHAASAKPAGADFVQKLKTIRADLQAAREALAQQADAD